MRITSLIFIVAFISISIIPAPKARAQFFSDIFISEVAYDLPGGDDPHEWIELYNAGTSTIDLTGWKFNDGSNHNLVAPPSIKSGEFAILADDAPTFLQDHPGFAGTVIDTVMSLNNSTDTLSLIRSDGSVADTLTYTSGLGASGNGKTLERAVDGALKESFADGGTPGAPNSVWQDQPQAQPSTQPTPSPPQNNTAAPPPPVSQNSQTQTEQIAYSTFLRLSELLPNPKGLDSESEFIEIENTGNAKADLSGWKIRDDSGKTLNLQGSINKNEFIAFNDKGMLNNDGDTVELLDPAGNRHDGVVYGKTSEGLALARTADSGQWQWTFSPTPNSANIFADTAAQSTPDNNQKQTTDVPITTAPVFNSGSVTTSKDGAAINQAPPAEFISKKGSEGAQNIPPESTENNGKDLAAALAPKTSSAKAPPLYLSLLISLMAGAAIFGGRIILKRKKPAVDVIVENDDFFE